MSQSLPCHAFGVRDGCEHRGTKYVEGRVDLHLAVKDEGIQCPHCQGWEYWRRGKRQRHSGTKIEAVACDVSGAYWSANQPERRF